MGGRGCDDDDDTSSALSLARRSASAKGAPEALRLGDVERKRAT